MAGLDFNAKLGEYIWDSLTPPATTWAFSNPFVPNRSILNSFNNTDNCKIDSADSARKVAVFCLTNPIAS